MRRLQSGWSFVCLFSIAAIHIGSQAGAAGIAAAPLISCSLDPASRVLTVTYAAPPADAPDHYAAVASIGMRDREIIVREFVAEGLASHFERRACGERPTGDNVDRIDLRLSGRAARTSTYLELREGPIGPGATHEPGGSEIELDADLGGGASFIALTGKRRRLWTLGASGGEYAVNFNPHETSPDADLVIRSEPVDVWLDGSPADDRLIATGGKGTGGPFTADLLLSGEGGDDLVVGGAADDYLNGGDGDDTIRGLRGDDRLDVKDRDGSDRLLCGQGDDRAGVDPTDSESGCEHLPPPP